MWSRKYKRCVVCGTIKIKHLSKGMCKKCYGKEQRKKNPEYNKEWRRKNFKKSKQYEKKYYKKNSEKIKQYGKEYYKKNFEKIKQYNKEWYDKKMEQDPDKLKKKNRERKRKWRKENLKRARHSTKIASRKWRKKNPGYMKKRFLNPQCKLKCNISNLINQRLRKRLLSKKGRSTFTFLPYTIEELMQHLEGQFQAGMTWENHGEWHIDHKKPDCRFNYKSVEDEEFQKCWALKNLQPLWAIDNIVKSDK